MFYMGIKRKIYYAFGLRRFNIVKISVSLAFIVHHDFYSYYKDDFEMLLTQNIQNNIESEQSWSVYTYDFKTLYE